MKEWLAFISMIASFVTLLGFIAIFVKIGREKGILEVTVQEMKKQIEKNSIDINSLGTKLNVMQIENTKLITTLSSDLGWIKSSLNDIKVEIKKRDSQ